MQQSKGLNSSLEPHIKSLHNTLEGERLLLSALIHPMKQMAYKTTFGDLQSNENRVGGVELRKGQYTCTMAPLLGLLARKRVYMHLEPFVLSQRPQKLEEMFSKGTKVVTVTPN